MRSVLDPRPQHQRGPCDCMRAVIATYLELRYEQTPDISGLADAATFWSDWSDWLRRRGLTLATYDFAPGHLRRWIAIVGLQSGGPLHAVLMSGTELRHDPKLGPDRMTSVRPADIMCAIVIGPLADHAWSDRITAEIALHVSRGSPLVWCLPRLMDSDWGVGMHRLRGEHAQADAMAARLGWVA